MLLSVERFHLFYRCLLLLVAPSKHSLTVQVKKQRKGNGNEQIRKHRFGKCHNNCNGGSEGVQSDSPLRSQYQRFSFWDGYSLTANYKEYAHKIPLFSTQPTGIQHTHCHPNYLYELRMCACKCMRAYVWVFVYSSSCILRMSLSYLPNRLLFTYLLHIFLDFAKSSSPNNTCTCATLNRHSLFKAVCARKKDETKRKAKTETE